MVTESGEGTTGMPTTGRLAIREVSVNEKQKQRAGFIKRRIYEKRRWRDGLRLEQLAREPLCAA